MIDRAHRVRLSGQAKLRGSRRGRVSYQRRPASPVELALMRRMDAVHVEDPFAGRRRLRGLLRQDGSSVGRLHVATLMTRLGIAALYRRPPPSHPTPGRQIYPSLFRKLAVASPNQVWAMDLTSGPMARGVGYRVAVVDWFSRTVLAWRRSITLETEPCVAALSEALARPGRPAIMNTEQGRPFTAVAVLTALPDATSASSLDGQGAWRDTVFVARRWRTINYEAVSRRADRRPHLAGTRPIRPISPSHRQARRRHNQRGAPRIDSSHTVQNSPATSQHLPSVIPVCVQ